MESTIKNIFTADKTDIKAVGLNPKDKILNHVNIFHRIYFKDYDKIDTLPFYSVIGCGVQVTSRNAKETTYSMI